MAKGKSPKKEEKKKGKGKEKPMPFGKDGKCPKCGKAYKDCKC